MSDIKPVAYTSQIDLDRVRKGKSGDIYGSQKWEGSNDAVFTMPLYTAEQLSKAVAAERERCAKLCESLASGTFPDIKNPSDADQRTIAWDACCDEAAEKIRSTAQ